MTDRRVRAFRHGLALARSQPGVHGGRLARNVFVLVVPTAASPKTRARYGLTCPEDALPWGLPADELMPGANFAHEHRCPAVGNRDM